ncbi:MAG: sulfite exporter TauE/SafE family protein [Cyanothece sp. SIO1E1]|nr:sulfite exporter TauE/SafE family protein [Cyanothece sp. SIO1E1]
MLLGGLDIFLFASLGITAGLLAGLLGIGGGMVIVPGLFYLFTLLKLPGDSLMHMAAGTSMCIMLCTSAASTWAHQSKGHVQWGIFKKIIAAIGIGVVSGNLLANRLNTEVLELLFGLLLLSVAIKILLAWKPKQDLERELPGNATTNAVGWAIGFKSGVLGVGGGALSVPFLLYCGLPMNQASGTSASFTLPIAVFGTLSFMLISGDQAAIPWATGYIYWPAFLLVAPFTVLGAPIGAKLSRVISAQKLRMVFAFLLLFLSAKMLGGVEHIV